MRLLLLACLVACGSSKPVPDTDPTMTPPPPPVTTNTSPGIEMPEVPSIGFDRADKAMPQISVSPTALTVKGKVVVTLADAQVGAADLQGGANGLIITKLREHARDLGAARVILKLDRRTSYLTLVQILSTLQLEGIGAVSILASSGPQLMSAPIELTPGPNRSGWVRHAVPGAGPSPRIQPVVALAASELKLYSISGTAGTKDKPALVMKANPGIDLAQLGAKLAELRKKHADAGDTVIVIAAADAMPVQTVLEVIATVRATPDGKALYPEILLGSERAR